MKFFALTILAVIGCALADSGELTSSEERMIENLLQNYKQSAKELTTNGMKGLAEAVCANKDTDLETPLNEVVKKIEAVNIDSQSVCVLVKDHLASSLEPMTKAIDGCLSNDQAGIASYAVDAVVAAVSWICEQKGETLLELVNPCIDNLNLAEGKCIENVETKWNEVTTTAGKSFRQEACSMYADIRPCLEGEIASRCKLQITKDAMLGAADAILKTPCAA